ncbi:MAG: GNAT family N-acetyltransferase [Sphingopyxis sp.]
MIGAAAPADAGPVTALIRAAYARYVPLLGRDPQPMTDDYAALIADGAVHILRCAGVLTGVVVCMAQGGDWLLRTVGIAPAAQRQGHGRRLIHHAEDWGRQAGHMAVRLYTNQVMAGNVSLYQNLGYRETHRAGPQGKQVIYMTKEL